MPRKKEGLLDFKEAPSKVNVTVRESNLTGENGKGTLYGSISRRKVSVKSILTEMEDNHASIVSKELLFYLAQELSSRMMNKLRHGYAVELLGFGTVFPTMKGSLGPNDTPSKIESHIEVGFTPSKQSRNAVKSLKVGHVFKVSAQHVIYSVSELLVEGAETNVIRCGRMAVIKGKAVKMGGDVYALYAAPVDESWDGNLPVRNEWIKIEHIAMNTPSQIEFAVEEIKPGTYIFIVETSLSAGGKPLKKSVVINSGIVKAIARGAE